MTSRRRSDWLQKALLVTGLLLIAQWSIDVLGARDFQARESRAFEAASRGTGGASVVASSGPRSMPSPLDSGPAVAAVEANGVLGRIEIPRLHIGAVIADGADEATLARAIGHISWTALPGDPGNCALAGHRDTFLRGLGEVRTNDAIHIVTRESTYLYQVDWSEVVLPRRIDVLDSTATRALTLVTCYPFVFVGHAPQRFVVRARQIGAIAGLLPARDTAGAAPAGATIQ